MPTAARLRRTAALAATPSTELVIPPPRPSRTLLSVCVAQAIMRLVSTTEQRLAAQSTDIGTSSQGLKLLLRFQKLADTMCYSGNTAAYCGAGCQPKYGTCTA